MTGVVLCRSTGYCLHFVLGCHRLKCAVAREVPEIYTRLSMDYSSIHSGLSENHDTRGSLMGKHLGDWGR